ncbi:MAG: hypothetical protein ACRD51_12835 [Candidatus Acidiferrum sp.]
MSASQAAKGSEILLEARALKKSYQRGGGIFSNEKEGAQFTAVDGVSLEVRRGETFAVVGESGCGKTDVGADVIAAHRAGCWRAAL